MFLTYSAGLAMSGLKVVFHWYAQSCILVRSLVSLDADLSMSSTIVMYVQQIR